MNRISVPHLCAKTGTEYRMAFVLRDSKYHCDGIDPRPTIRAGILSTLKREVEEPQAINASLIEDGYPCLCGNTEFIYCHHGKLVCGARSSETEFRCSRACGLNGRMSYVDYAVSASEAAQKQARLAGPAKKLLR